MTAVCQNQTEIRHYMTAPVVTVMPNAIIEEVLEKMMNNRISGMPVVDEDGALLGIVSEFDALMLLDEDEDHGPVAPVSLFMSRSVLSIDETATVGEVARVFLENPVRRLPVLREGKMVGIVSRRDMARIIRDQRWGQQNTNEFQ